MTFELEIGFVSTSWVRFRGAGAPWVAPSAMPVPLSSSPIPSRWVGTALAPYEPASAW